MSLTIEEFYTAVKELPHYVAYNILNQRGINVEAKVTSLCAYTFGGTSWQYFPAIQTSIGTSMITGIRVPDNRVTFALQLCLAHGIEVEYASS